MQNYIFNIGEQMKYFALMFLFVMLFNINTLTSQQVKKLPTVTVKNLSGESISTKDLGILFDF